MNHNTREKRIYLLFLVVITIGMLWMQLLDTFTLSDDLAYRFIFQEDENSPLQLVNNLNDLLHSQWIHYHTINGRWFIHFLAQGFLCLTPSYVYKIISAFLFTLMVFLGTTLVDKTNNKLFISVLICFFLFVVSTGFRTTMLWSLGTFNYLWVITFTLAFLVYLKSLGDKKISIVHWFISPLSILAGCCHEAISLPISITFLIYILLNIKKVISLSVFPYMIWYVLGTVTILLSPALWSRADSGVTLVNRLLSGSINIFFNMKIAWILLITLIYVFRKDKNKVKNDIKKNRYIYLCFMLSLGIIVVCGTNLERVAFYTDFIALILLLKLWSDIISLKWHKTIIYSCLVIMLIFFIPTIMVRSENYNNCEIMKQQLKEPGKEIISVIQPIKGESPILDYFRHHYVNPSAEFGFYCCYMGFNDKDISIRQAAKLYGKNKVLFIPEEIIHRIETDSLAYNDYELDRNKQLYVWRLENQQKVNKVLFYLKPEDMSKLWPHQRLLSYRHDIYELDDNFHYNVVQIEKKNYLFFTCPTTNIFRRIKRIEVQ